MFLVGDRHLTGEVSTEWQEREEKDRADLSRLTRDIVPYLMQHNAEAEACDLLMEIEKLDQLEQYVEESAYSRVCLYLTRYVTRDMQMSLPHQVRDA